MKKKQKIYIKRDKSIITNKKNLEKLFVIKNFPVYIGTTKNSPTNDLFFNIDLCICRDTGIIQLKRILLPEIIYSKYHSEALGKVWEDHHSKFINFIKKFGPQNILEIGGSNGFIAKNYIKNNKVNKWIIVEPNPSIKTEKKIKVVEKIFDSNFIIKDRIDSVIHSHTFEHIHDPRDFLKAIYNLLPEAGLNIFSVPNFFSYMKNKQSNILNFEHTIFLTEYFIDELLRMHGFKILKKEYYKNHSIFYSTQKIINNKMLYKGKNKYKEYKNMFNKYIAFYLKLIERYNKKINNYDGEIYVFGAHVFSQFLFALGLNDSIVGILDNSKIKQGERLYGTPLKVYSPIVIKGNKKAVILRAGIYQDEVKDQLLKINPSVVIWE